MFDYGEFMEQVQKEFDTLKKRLQNTTFQGNAQGGRIRALANGLQLLIALDISPDLNPAYVTEDILAACNQALNQARHSLNRELTALTGGYIDFGDNG